MTTTRRKTDVPEQRRLVHPRWVSPLEKQAECWSNHFTDTEITDPETIARLERDEPPEGDDASINRPVDLDKLDPESRKELEARSQQRKRATAHED